MYCTVAANNKIVDVNAIPDGWMGLDIGPKTIEELKVALSDCKVTTTTTTTLYHRLCRNHNNNNNHHCCKHYHQIFSDAPSQYFPSHLTFVPSLLLLLFLLSLALALALALSTFSLDGDLERPYGCV